MSEQMQKSASGGIGFFGLLTLVFIVLKLIGVNPIVNWPWFSFNPFEWSVLMFFITWPVFIALVILLGIVIYLLIQTIRGKL